MFDIGWTEMLVVAVVMILVVGPKDLPGMLRTIGKSIGNMRRLAGDFQRQFSDALKEAEIDEVKKGLTDATSFDNPLDDINKSVRELMEPVDIDDDIIADVSTTKPAGTPIGKKPRARRKKAGKLPAKTSAKTVTKKPAKARVKKAGAPKRAPQAAPKKAKTRRAKTGSKTS